MAGSFPTGMLLISAVVSGFTAGPAAGPRRLALARAGLIASATGCVIAAFVQHIVAVLAGMLALGSGSGIAVATSSAALGGALDVGRTTSAAGVISRVLSAALLALVVVVE